MSDEFHGFVKHALHDSWQQAGCHGRLLSECMQDSPHVCITTIEPMLLRLVGPVGLGPSSFDMPVGDSSTQPFEASGGGVHVIPRMREVQAASHDPSCVSVCRVCFPVVASFQSC